MDCLGFYVVSAIFQPCNGGLVGKSVNNLFIIGIGDFNSLMFELNCFVLFDIIQTCFPCGKKCE